MKKHLKNNLASLQVGTNISFDTTNKTTIPVKIYMVLHCIYYLTPYVYAHIYM